jgi:nucleotide-binding universal stress UspA family protein
MLGMNLASPPRMTTLFKRILVPLDLSDCSRAALRLAFGLAEVHRSEIDVLLVVPSDDSGTDAQRKLQGFVEASGVPATVVVRSHVDRGDPRECILLAARAKQSDVIVLGTHGRTGRTRSLAGSVAESVVRTAECPVITIREAA